jgi:hypothetical protein
VTLIRNYSSVAVSHFQNETLDFIYIDARHGFCGSSQDMDSYFPKLKCGGLFAGHDFEFASPGQDWSLCADGSSLEGSDKRAVLEFAERNSLTNVLTTRELTYPSLCTCSRSVINGSEMSMGDNFETYSLDLLLDKNIT